jgi:hypothetical protein
VVGYVPTAASVCPSLRPEVGEEGLRVVDVAGKMQPTLVHQLLVALGDGDLTLRLAVKSG